nr:hypothetical protein [Tanacetum cinerariifolium]
MNVVGARECRKPKRVKDSTYHKEKILLCKQAEKGVLLQAEQYDWLADMDEEINEYKGKEIAKPITPPSESASEEDSDPESSEG